MSSQAIIYSLLTGCLFWGVIYGLYWLQKRLVTWIGRKLWPDHSPIEAYENTWGLAGMTLATLMGLTMALTVTFVIGAVILLAIFE